MRPSGRFEDDFLIHENKNGSIRSFKYKTAGEKWSEKWKKNGLDGIEELLESLERYEGRDSDDHPIIIRYRARFFNKRRNEEVSLDIGIIRASDVEDAADICTIIYIQFPETIFEIHMHDGAADIDFRELLEMRGRAEKNGVESTSAVRNPRFRRELPAGSCSSGAVRNVNRRCLNASNIRPGAVLARDSGVTVTETSLTSNAPVPLPMVLAGVLRVFPASFNPMMRAFSFSSDRIFAIL